MKLEAAMAIARPRLVPFFARILFALLFLTPAAAGEAGAEARAVIQRQLDAFASDDAGAAYALAAPGIKAIFMDSATFMAMVRRQYAPVYHHRRAEFAEFSSEGDAVSQTLTIVDDDGQVWTALYKLARQPDGAWLITGCLLIKADAKDA
jgi:hypothetical protein